MAKGGDREFVDHVLEALGPGFTAEGMFGGFGIYGSGPMMGIAYQGRLYFWTDETTRPAYLAEGMESFSPKPGIRLGDYLEVPPEVQASPKALREWAEASAAARRNA